MHEESAEQTRRKELYNEFKAQVAGEDDTIDLARAALLISKFFYPTLDSDAYLARLDALAQRVQATLAMQATESAIQDEEEEESVRVLYALNHVLFEEEHFRGNANAYYQPDNSFLNRVLEEHQGLPIMLSLLYMEVAKRIDVSIDGIGLPYHFVVRYHVPGKNIYIDPFEGGLLMNEKECRERIRHLTHGKVRLTRAAFEPVSKKHLLARLLTNLKHIYLNSEDYDHVLIMSNLILILLPDLGKEYRDRGIINYQLQHYGRAIRDLKRYTELEPDAKDRYEILNHIKMIRETLARLN